jgi:hypothetical protein
MMKKEPASLSDLQRLVARLARFIMSKPEAESEPEDPFAGVRSPKKRGPVNRSGAVALAVPDKEGENKLYPPRKM